MDYKQKVAAYIERDEIPEMIAWAKLQPFINQVEILSIFKDFLKAGIVGRPTKKGLKQAEDLDQKIENFLESVLDSQMLSLQLAFAKQDVSMVMKKILGRPGVHQYIVSCIVNNGPDAEQMKTFALNAIQYEKELGIFNPDNWKGIDW